MNGCRTPLMDGALRGALAGLSLAHGPEHLYRALLEASAFGLRWIVELLVEGGAPVRRLVATGGLPHNNPLLVQIYADVLQKPIVVPPSKQGPALGAAILGVLAAGPKTTGFRSASAAIRAMAQPNRETPGRAAHSFKPRRALKKTYDQLYRKYREMARVMVDGSS
jgi:L-ribulokinase